MNALSLEALGRTRASAYEGERFHLMPVATQRRVLARAIDWGVMNGVDEIRRRRGYGVSGMGDLSQQEQSSVASSVASALTPIFSGTAKNLSQQAADVIGPVMEQKLKEYGPTFAIIMGLVASTLTVLGMALFGSYIVGKLR